jgi:CrcB protein
MDETVLVGVGGCLGSIGRYGLGKAVHSVLPNLAFPLSTLIANLLGSFLIGLIMGWSIERGILTPRARAFFVVGILGGFTTFSSLSLETFQLISEDRLLMAFAYALGSLTAGLACVWAGHGTGQMLGAA